MAVVLDEFQVQFRARLHQAPDPAGFVLQGASGHRTGHRGGQQQGRRLEQVKQDELFEFAHCR